MREQLISFKTAKLAKEKGINLSFALNAYALEDLFKNEDPNYNKGDLVCTALEHDSIYFIEDKLAYAPPQNLLQKLLREEKGIIVLIHKVNHANHTYYPVIHLSDRVIMNDAEIFYKKTYEEALEKGLKEALKYG